MTAIWNPVVNDATEPPHRYLPGLWIVTELCEGGSLVDVMRHQNAPLGEVQVAAVVGGTLEGLRYLHGKKMLHRDVKAGNLLLSRDGRIKLGVSCLESNLQCGPSLMRVSASRSGPVRRTWASRCSSSRRWRGA